jgi:CRISPR-associated protein Csx1
VGVFENWNFIGNMEDFYGYVPYKFVDILSAEFDKDLEDLEPYLDLTHGINFMPVLTYRAIREISEIITANATLHVYNSDPYRREASLRIHLVELSRIPWRPNLHKLHWRLRLLKTIDYDLEEVFSGILEKFKKLNVDELNAFVGSIVNGLPLVLFHFYPDVETLGKLGEETISLYEKYVIIQKNVEDGRIEVKRLLSLGEDFPSLVKVILIAKLLKEFGPRRKEIELELLEKLREKVFSRNEKINAMIMNEIYKFKEIKSSLSGEWKLSKEFFGEAGKYRSRNFLAHSGFEKNVTEVKIRGDGSILLRYNENLINRVVKDSARGIYLPKKEIEQTSFKKSKV